MNDGKQNPNPDGGTFHDFHCTHDPCDCVERIAMYDAAVQALRDDVWQEHKKGLRPFDGRQENASWLAISVEGDVVGWDINRAARIAVDAAVKGADDE